MDKLEIHSLICKKDINLLFSSIKLFTHYTNLKFNLIIHEDGSFDNESIAQINKLFSHNAKIIFYKPATSKVVEILKDYPLCRHFRESTYHTIFRIKLFDPFIFTDSGNILYMDSDILFCKYPTTMINYINAGIPFYLRDMCSSYCVPFRKEDSLNSQIIDSINAGLNYYPNRQAYNLDFIEECLTILYDNGSRNATHPFLEQTAIAYMITKLNNFKQLPHPDYCVPNFNKFISNHNLTALHLNSSPLVGKYREEHYRHELKKIK